MRLKGKIALITGAARGHAEAIARRFSKEGASVAICDILPVHELKKQVGATIEAEGGKVLCFQTDVSKEDQVQKMVEETLQHFGTIAGFLGTVSATTGGALGPIILGATFDTTGSYDWALIICISAYIVGAVAAHFAPALGPEPQRAVEPRR